MIPSIAHADTQPRCVKRVNILYSFDIFPRDICQIMGEYAEPGILEKLEVLIRTAKHPKISLNLDEEMSIVIDWIDIVRCDPSKPNIFSQRDLDGRYMWQLDIDLPLFNIQFHLKSDEHFICVPNLSLECLNPDYWYDSNSECRTIANPLMIKYASKYKRQIMARLAPYS